MESKKRKNMHIDYTQCIICEGKEGKDAKDLQKVTETGYPSLLFAIENRNDNVSHRLYTEGRDEQAFLKKNPKWHSKCRAKYTNKKTVNQLKKKMLRSDEEEDKPSLTRLSDVQAGPSTRRSTGIPQEIDMKDICFVCEKDRDKNGSHKLLYVATEDRERGVRDKAIELDDEKMLCKLGGRVCCADLVARDFRYHSLCLSNYLLLKKTEDNEIKESTYDTAFKQLLKSENFEEEIFQNEGVMCVNYLRNKFRNLLQEQGIETYSSYKSSRLTKRLTNMYGDNVTIFPQAGASSLVCSKQLPAGKLFSQVNKLNKQNENDFSQESDGDSDDVNGDNSNNANVVFHAAKHLRSELKNDEKEEQIVIKTAKENLQGMHDLASHGLTTVEQPTGSILAMNVNYETAYERVNTKLYNHMAWLVTDADAEIGDDGHVILNRKQHEKVLNIAQDITASVTGIATPKQIGTALYLLKETRSKTIVTLLNRFGNCISYKDAQRYIGTMAEMVSKKEKEDGIFIPFGMMHGLFTQTADDNLDFPNLHATTHIFYQYNKNQSKDSGFVPLCKVRATSMKAAPFTTNRSGLTLNDRRKARSVANVTFQHEDLPSSDCLNDINLVWQIGSMYPTTLLETVDESDMYAFPNWSDFNHVVDGAGSEATGISYGSIFPSSPTDSDVVEKSLDYVIEVSQKLGNEFTVHTCDQAIYDIALGLKKKKHVKYEKLILRMGGFHLALNFMGAIGFFMKGTGLEEVLVHGKVCTRGVANKIIAGKDYYEILEAYTIVQAAIFQLFWDQFETWLIAHGKEYECFPEISNCISDILKSMTDKDGDNVCDLLDNPQTRKSLKEIAELLEQFKVKYCVAPTAKLWLMFIEMVDILKHYIQAERFGLWKDHLAEAHRMLPFLVSAGHTNYSACLPHYLEDMRNLPTTAPVVDEAFRNGNFSVHQLSGAFNGVWTDMALEQTYNKDAKTHLFHGIAGSQSAMDKYLKALPLLSGVSEEVKSMAHLGVQNSRTLKCREKQTCAINKSIHNVKTAVEDKMINPFREDVQELGGIINISTGLKCDSLDIIQAQSKGIAALKEAADRKSDKIPVVKIKTFATKEKKPQSKVLKAQQLLKEERLIIRSMLFMDNVNDAEKRAALSHEWTNYPASLFEPCEKLKSGYAMRKGSKADYYHAIKTFLGEHWIETESIEKQPGNTVLIIDAGYFLHKKMSLGCTTYMELASKYIDEIFQVTDANVINVVADRYDFPLSQSLKHEERERRMKGKLTRNVNYQPDDKLELPPFHDIMESMEGKANLMNYFSTSWQERHHLVPQGKVLILGGMGKERGSTTRLTHTDSVEIGLHTDGHEEADTRLFVHLTYCVTRLGLPRIIIHANDTDIFVMAMYCINRVPGLEELWIYRDDTFIPIHSIVLHLSMKCQAGSLHLTSLLLGGYILSGCDTVSYPFMKGKKTALKVITSNPTEFEGLATFQEQGSNTTEEACLKSCTAFFCALYGRFGFIHMDILRSHLFACSKADLRSLPPTQDAFVLHAKRAIYQMILYKEAINGQINVPSPTNYGRTIRDGMLMCVMMQKEAKPVALLSKRKVYCKCSDSKCLAGCRCKNARVDCTAGCLCTGDPERCHRINAELAIVSD